MTQVSVTKSEAQILEAVLLGGDLSGLPAAQRVEYYNAVCSSLGLNPLTKPFDYLRLNNKLTLYAGRNATDQLRSTRNITLTITARERHDDLYVVTARATMPDGRSDESIGAVPLGSLGGEQLANALMRAETKAKRRVTLSICGLSWADESEVSSIPSASPVRVDTETGEILDGAAAVASRAKDRVTGGGEVSIETLEAGRRAMETQQFTGPLAGEELRKKVYDLSVGLGWKTGEYIRWIRVKYGVTPVKLTQGQAAEAANYLATTDAVMGNVELVEMGIRTEPEEVQTYEVQADAWETA